MMLCCKTINCTNGIIYGIIAIYYFCSPVICLPLSQLGATATVPRPLAAAVLLQCTDCCSYSVLLNPVSRGLCHVSASYPKSWKSRLYLLTRARSSSGLSWVRRVWVMLAEGPPAWVWVCGNRSRCWERPTLPSSEPRSRSRVSMCRMKSGLRDKQLDHQS